MHTAILNTNQLVIPRKPYFFDFQVKSAHHINRHKENWVLFNRILQSTQSRASQRTLAILQLWPKIKYVKRRNKIGTPTIIILVTLLVILATLIPSYRISKKKGVTESEWAIGGRALPLYVVVGTQFASSMGGGILVGQVGNAYSNGIGMLLYAVLAEIPILCIIFVGKWLRSHNYTTIPELLGTFSRKNKVVTITAALMSLIVPFGWVTSQITAFGNIYSKLLGIDYNVICVVFAVISLLFILPSGLTTVAWTDFIFACFMIAMCIFSIVYVTFLGGGVSEIVSTVKDLNPDLLSFTGSIRNNIGTSTALLWLFSVMPGGLTNQIYFQRVCAIDDEKKVAKSLLLTVFLGFLTFVWAAYMGISIYSINQDVASGATSWFMEQLPVPFLALFAALIFATLMSTASSGIQTAVVNITRDIIPALAPNMDNAKTLKLSRVLSVALMVIAILMCLVFTDTLGWLVSTYAFSAAALACPIFLCYAFRKKAFITTQGIAAGMIGGIVGCALAMILKTAINYAAIGIAVSFVLMLIVSAATKKDAVPPEEINKMME